jgi:16S rRNA (guanine(966)-N(2))-methyltransferase RsmD
MGGRNAVRITGGTLRGQRVAVPHGARPSEGRVREALFSRWQERLPDARFLDLFAGSGAVALEAVSRGAAFALCVESDLSAVRQLEATLRRLAGGRVRVRRANLPAGLAAVAEGPFDLAFADPPYRFHAHEGLVAAVAPLLAPDGELAIEHSARVELPGAVATLAMCDQRRYGESALSFYQAAP